MYKKFKEDYIDIFTNVMWECFRDSKISIYGNGDQLTMVVDPSLTSSNPRIQPFLEECKTSFAFGYYVLPDRPLKMEITFQRGITKIIYTWKEWYLEDLFREAGLEKLYQYYTTDPEFVRESLQVLDDPKAHSLIQFINY